MGAPGGSLLEAAVASAHHPTVQSVLRGYRRRCPQSLVWQYDAGHGVWDTYPRAVQQRIRQALSTGMRTLTVEAEGGVVALDLDTLRHHMGMCTRDMRCHFQTGPEPTCPTRRR